MSHAFRMHVPQKSAALPSRTGSHMVSNTRSQLSGNRVYQEFAEFAPDLTLRLWTLAAQQVDSGAVLAFSKLWPGAK